jgi:hypothetical protein
LQSIKVPRELSSSSSINNLPTIHPERSYNNADTQKEQIVADNIKNKGKTVWKPILRMVGFTGSCYVGSSLNLASRLATYFSIKALQARLANGRSIISSALLKYGYSNFSLHILKYCEAGLLTVREQYYIDLLNPDYNILRVAVVFTTVRKETIRGGQS